MLTAELIQQTEQRFSERQSIREMRQEKIRSGAILEADTPDRVRKRIQRVAAMVIETEGVGLPMPGQPPGAGTAVLERILGKNDLMSVRYLELAVRIARTVGRVHVKATDGSHRGYGTGFLVSPKLLLTNNHVLDSAAAAGASRVEFDFQESVDGKLLSSILLSLDPSAFFLTDKALDFALVALKGDLRKVATFGWNGLLAAEGKVIAGEYVSIIQHPSGERKQVAIRENQIIDVLDSFLHYRTDTSPGSSGSPVFNDQWEIVALHHSGVPSKDAQGRLLTKDGKVWTKSMGEHAIHWVANEGVRISRILKHLQGLSLSGGQATLRKELLDSPSGWQAGAGSAKEAVEIAGLEGDRSGSVYTLPLQLVIDVGRLTNGAGTPAPAPSVEGSTASMFQPMEGDDIGMPEPSAELANVLSGLNGHGAPSAAPETAEEWLVAGNGFSVP